MLYPPPSYSIPRWKQLACVMKPVSSMHAYSGWKTRFWWAHFISQASTVSPPTFAPAFQHGIGSSSISHGRQRLFVPPPREMNIQARGALRQASRVGFSPSCAGPQASSPTVCVAPPADRCTSLRGPDDVRPDYKTQNSLANTVPTSQTTTQLVDALDVTVRYNQIVETPLLETSQL